MSQAENMLALITIVFGLMLTDLFASLHRLIRQRRRVRWHWLPLLVAWYVLALILKNWWGIVSQADSGAKASGWAFVFYGHLLLLLYLVASAALPDEVPSAGLDMRAYYLGHRRQFWGLMSGVSAILMLNAVIGPLLTGSTIQPAAVIVNLLMASAALSLAWVGRIGYHGVLVLVFTALLVLEMISTF